MVPGWRWNIRAGKPETMDILSYSVQFCISFVGQNYIIFESLSQKFHFVMKVIFQFWLCKQCWNLCLGRRITNNTSQTRWETVIYSRTKTHLYLGPLIKVFIKSPKTSFNVASNCWNIMISNHNAQQKSPKMIVTDQRSCIIGSLDKSCKLAYIITTWISPDH